MQGIEERIVDGIRVVRVHYTADERKRSKEWKDKTHEGVSERDWRREYEIDWTIASGLPVYADTFVREWHVAKSELLAYERKTIYRGWDFGLQPACVFCQLDPMGRLNVLNEMLTWDGRGAMVQQGIESFAPAVVLQSNEWYPNAEFKDFADPAGWSKSQTDERTCVDIMREHKIYPVKGPMTWTERKARMVETLNSALAGRPRIQISPTCTMIIEGFEGAYRYEEIGETGRYKETVEKNAWSHIMDSLAYVVGGLFSAPQRAERPLPKRSRPNNQAGY